MIHIQSTTSTIDEPYRKKPPIVVASRKTDFPAFYLPLLINGLTTRTFEYQTFMRPKKILRWDSPDDLHSIALWSQNFGPYLTRKNEIRDNYRFSYRFSVLPDDSFLKPAAPPLLQQLEQIQRLRETVRDPRAVGVYIDPLVKYRAAGGSWKRNDDEPSIDAVCSTVQAIGGDSITISLCDYYPHIDKRCRSLGYEIHYWDMSDDDDRNEVFAMVTHIRNIAHSYGLTLKSCAEKELAAMGLTAKGSCVDGKLLSEMYGPCETKAAKVHGASCGCTPSIDVGFYSLTCGHCCPQCYSRYR